MTLFREARSSLRSLLKNPTFSAVALITLTLSIAACCTIFSLINNALFRPLPFKDADELVLVWENNQQKGVDWFPVSPANFYDWKRNNQVFEDVAALKSMNLDLSGGENPERISSAAATPNFFQVMGVQALVGRTLMKDDEGQQNVLISEGFWDRRFASDTKVVGKSLILNGKSYVVVGVISDTFRTPRGAELWIPLSFSPEEASERSGRSLAVWARLKDGVSLGSAQTHMAAIADQLQRQYPDANLGWSISLVSARQQWIGEARTALLVLQGAVVLILLIGCANVANLILARAQGRRGEFAVRVAMGAERKDLIRFLLIESLVMISISAVFSLVLTHWVLKVLPAIVSDHLPWLDGLVLDGRVIAFTLLLVLIATAIIGVIPALQASRVNLTSELREGGTRSTAGARRQLFQHGLIVSEVAMALVLAIGAGLLVASYRQLQKEDLGFRADNLVTARIVLSEMRYPESEQWVSLFGQVLERLRSNPNVEAVAAGTTVPFTGVMLSFDASIQGRSQVAGEKGIDTVFDAVTPDYFRAMGMRLVKGRDFTAMDRANAPRVAIVNRTLAQSLLGGEEVMNQPLILGSDEPRQIVGIVEDTKTEDLSAPARPAVYVPYEQEPWEFVTIVLRSRSHPERMENDIRRAVFSVDRNQPVFGVATMEERLADSLSQRRFSTSVLTSFAFLALVLAFVGVYGLISYQVSQSTHEIGIRVALGAQRQDVLALVLGRVLRLVLVGVAVGLACAFGLTRFLEHLLFGISTTDLRAFSGLGLLLTLVGVAAGYFPARRATRVQPIVGLKYQ